MKAWLRLCSGDHEHQVIEGCSSEGNPPQQQQQGEYTPTFLRGFLRPVLRIDLSPYAGAPSPGSNTAAESKPEAEEPGSDVPLARDSPLDSMGRALRKLHNSLGHPSTRSPEEHAVVPQRRRSAVQVPFDGWPAKPRPSLRSPCLPQGRSSMSVLGWMLPPGWCHPEDTQCEHCGIWEFVSADSTLVCPRDLGTPCQAYRQFWLTWP